MINPNLQDVVDDAESTPYARIDLTFVYWGYPSGRVERCLQMMEIDTIYRVTLYEEGPVRVVTFGMLTPEPGLVGLHKAADSLPQWMLEKLAVLRMLPLGPDSPDIAGVGKRITEKTFWVYTP